MKSSMFGLGLSQLISYSVTDQSASQPTNTSFATLLSQAPGFQPTSKLCIK